MRAKLFLPYFPPAEVAGVENEMTDEEYSDALTSYYTSAYHKFMENAIRGYVDDRYNIHDVIPEKYQIKAIKEKKVPSRYYSFDVLLNDMYDRPLAPSFFANPRNLSSMNAFTIHILVDDEKNEDGLSELALWVRESGEIMKDPRIDEEKKIEILPPKDLKIDISEELNGIIYQRIYLFDSCRIPEQDDKNNFAIIVNKIERT